MSGKEQGRVRAAYEKFLTALIASTELFVQAQQSHADACRLKAEWLKLASRDYLEAERQARGSDEQVFLLTKYIADKKEKLKRMDL